MPRQTRHKPRRGPKHPPPALPHRPLLHLPPKGQHQAILLFDIENSPHEGYTWGVWEQNVIEITQPSHLLSVAYKWLGEKETHVLSLPMYDIYDDDKRDDYFISEDIHTLFSHADVVVAHNASAHDIPFCNWRFLVHKMQPIKPYKVVDTLLVRRRLVKQKAPSNKLNDISKEQGYGQKVEHEGFPLWTACIAGDMKAWAKMEKYNKHDVVLLEKAYLDLRGWMPNHPKAFGHAICKVCDSNHVQYRGYTSNLAGKKFRVFQCLNCRGYGRVVITE